MKDEEAISKRPHWNDDQVMAPEEIIPGHFYFRKGKGSMEMILALSTPKKTGQGYTFFYTNARSKDSVEIGICSDMGVTAYSTGLWNSTNYLLRSKKSPVGSADLTELQKKLLGY